MTTIFYYNVIILFWIIFFGSISLLVLSLKYFKKEKTNDTTPYVNDKKEVDELLRLKDNDIPFDCEAVN